MKFTSYNVPRKEKIFVYDYGGGLYKLVKGCFRESGWVENNPVTSKINDKFLKGSSSDAARSRARSRVYELAYCNDFEYFYTQTFAMQHVDRFSVEAITNKIQQNFKYFKKKHAPDFQYVLVAELHKNPMTKDALEMKRVGRYALHLHGLIKGVPDKEIYKNDRGYFGVKYFDKSLGGSSISKVKGKDRVSKYILKYITKEAVQFSNKYYYLCSRGLKRAIVSQIELPEPLSHWKKFDYVEIYDLDLNLINSNDSIINECSKDLISILHAVDVNSSEITPFLDCVKLRFSALYDKLKEKEGA